VEVFPRRVEIYEKDGGKAPFVEWLESLADARARALIKVRLDRVRLGNLGDCKALRGGLFEFRVDYGPGYRVYFGKAGERVVVLLCGGGKKSQASDISIARRYWADYRSRKHAQES
jgi:putative addiction module killer protein